MWYTCILVIILDIGSSCVAGQVTPTDVYVSPLQPFEGVPIDPQCDSGGPFGDDNRACEVPNRLTDGVLGDSSPVNFTQFSAWSRTTTPMPKIYFQFPMAGTPNTFHIRQIDLYFYKNATQRVGLPDVRLHVASTITTVENLYVAIPFTIISNQSISDIDNQTVKVSLVDTLNQDDESYVNNLIVRMTFNFNNSDTLDWMLISEVMMFNGTAVPPPQPPIIFTQDQVTVVRTIDLVSYVRLTCSVTNDAAFEWSWTGPNGAMISSSSSVFVADLTRTSVLQISSLSLSDAGSYNCTAAFLIGNVPFSWPLPFEAQNSSLISLQMEGSVISSDPVTVTANNGSNADLSCEFSGYLPHSGAITWENNQETVVVVTPNRFSIKQSSGSSMAQNGSSSPINSVVSTLTITSVVLTDAGNYTCRMRGDNNAELMGTAQLIVTLPPSSVTPTPVINIPTLSSAMTIPVTSFITIASSIYPTSTTSVHSPESAPVSQLSIVLLSLVMILIVIIIMVVIIASVIVNYYKKKQKKKMDEYDYVETYSLPSNHDTRDHIVAMCMATSDNPAYGVLLDSKPTQPTVSNDLPIEQITTAIYEDIPQ